MTNLQQSINQIQRAQDKFGKNLTQLTDIVDYVDKRQQSLYERLEKEERDHREQNIRVFNLPMEPALNEDGRREKFQKYCQEN